MSLPTSGSGHLLGGHGSGLAEARDKQFQQMQIQISNHKTKELEKRRKKVEEMMRRYPHLNLGNTLGIQGSSSLLTARQLEDGTNKSPVSCSKEQAMDKPKVANDPHQEIDFNKQMREIRRQQQENYNAAIK